ncbi:MAG: hypothetical protein ACE5E1_10810, partial [Phycisphaerae bacterium]
AGGWVASIGDGVQGGTPARRDEALPASDECRLREGGGREKRAESCGIISHRSEADKQPKL